MYFTLICLMVTRTYASTICVNTPGVRPSRLLSLDGWPLATGASFSPRFFPLLFFCCFPPSCYVASRSRFFSSMAIRSFWFPGHPPCLLETQRLWARLSAPLQLGDCPQHASQLCHVGPGLHSVRSDVWSMAYVEDFWRLPPQSGDPLCFVGRVSLYCIIPKVYYVIDAWRISGKASTIRNPVHPTIPHGTMPKSHEQRKRDYP